MSAGRQLIGEAGRSFIQRFALHTGQSSDALISAVEAYNRDYSAYGNEVYSQLETRVAHWANYLDQGWFQRRLDFPFSIAPDYDVIVDLGFSVPYAFTLPHLRNAERCNFIFVDREESTLDFYKALLSMENWGFVSNRAKVSINDLEKEQELQKVKDLIQELEPKSVLIIASEILEHLHDPEPVMQWMSDFFIQNSILGCTLYMTLPIGTQIPSHKVEFLEPENASTWLARYIPHHNAFVLRPEDNPLTPHLQSVYCACADSLQIHTKRFGV